MNTVLKRSARLVSTVLCGLAVLGLVCSREQNPFADRSNAQAVLTRSSFSHGDSLQVFERETLDVSLAVAELIDSFTVSAPKNRLWGDDTTIVVPAAAAARTYRLIVSFYDTGWQEIEVLTFRRGGEQVREQVRVYCSLPLSQDTVAGTFDDTVHLASPPVKDNDVVYHWDFGKGNIVSVPRPAASAVVRDAGFDGIGKLWVSDEQEAHVSPAVMFAYSFNDTIGPQIVCVNDGFQGKDTIRTGAASCFLRVRISDRGRQADTVSVSGGAFDIVEGLVYVKVFYQMDTVAGVLPVIVWARDNEADRNETAKTFFLDYDASIPSVGQSARIVIQIPTRDSTVSGVRSRYVLGSIENYTGENVLVAVSVNGTAAGTNDTLGEAFTSQWGRSVYLSQAVNTVVVRASGLSGSVLDTTAFTMRYDSLVVDSVAPTILSVTLDGEAADGRHVEADTVSLRIVALDEEGGVVSLAVNGQSGTAGGTIGEWYAIVPLVHGSEGNTIRIVAADNAGLTADTSIEMFQNASPRLRAGLSLPYPLVVGTAYTDTLIVEDADGDRVYFEKAVGPPGISVSEDGVVGWQPAMGDTGVHALVVRFRDGLASALYACSLKVVDSVFFQNAVRFKVTEQDFPAFVHAGVDTVRVPLLTVSGTGAPPFDFVACRRIGSACEDIPVSGNELVWAPELKDTGYQHFVIRVEDQLSRADTLYPRVLVVVPNRACSLVLSHGIDTLSDGTLDLRDSTTPVTLQYAIGDADLAEVEAYEVVVARGGREDMRSLGGADSFQVVLDPANGPPGRDTIIVKITDAGGHSDADTIIVLYRGSRVLMKTAAAGVTEDVYGFPLLVRLNSSNFEYWADVASDGSDIRFSKPDGTALAVEVERWDQAGQKADVWVSVDTIRGGNDRQYIEMYWGDGSAPGGSSGPAVFDSTDGFEAVWHLGASLADATGRGNDGTNHGSVLVEGVAGQCRGFDGAGQYIDLGTGLPILMDASQTTVEAWVKTASTTTNQVVFGVQMHNASKPDSRISLGVEIQPSAASIITHPSDEFSQYRVHTPGGISTGAWHHVTGIVDLPRDTAYIYIDGVQAVVSYQQFSVARYPGTLCDVGAIGSEDNGKVFFLEGFADEIRISRTRRSASWIKLSFENQRAGSSLVSIE